MAARVDRENSHSDDSRPNEPCIGAVIYIALPSGGTEGAAVDNEPARDADPDEVAAKMRKMLAENRAMMEKNRALMAKIQSDLKRSLSMQKSKIE